jgi:transcriptional regulator with XRE-family HTH domain
MPGETPGNKRQGGAASFGERLRRLRETAGLTQEELASRAGLTAKAISALERGERRRPYPHTVRALAEALELSEEERASLTEAVPRREGGEAPTPELREVATSLSTLPASLTPLLGREREVEEIGRLLSREAVRLLTLTGPGGIGKTRLVIEAAREATGSFPGGVAFVGLAPLADAALVMPTVSQALGLREAGGLPPLEALLETAGIPLYAQVDRELQQRVSAAGRERLGEQDWATAREEGRAMSFEEAVAYARDGDEALPSGRIETPASGLARPADQDRTGSSGTGQ